MSSVRPIRDEVIAPRAPSFARLREGVFGGSVRRLAGLVRFDGQAMRMGPIALLTFGQPVFEQPAWRWPITGGLLARRPGGWVVVGWHKDELYCEVRDYQPRLPGPIFLLTQLPFHHMVTRLALLDLRGRAPAPGLPAEPVRRLAAGVLDAVLCGAIVVAWRPRRRLAAVLGTALLYHVGFWSIDGQTPGACLAGIRVVSADGSPIRPVQALLRVLTLPLGIAGLRARHDDLAGTEVVRAQP
jgi:hypothetical protein